MPASIVSMDQFQEGLKVMLPLMLTGKKQPLPAAEVHRTEDDATSVPARDPHASGFAASAPVGAQRRKEKQIGLVFYQQHAVGRQVPDSAANSSFFSRARDRASVRSGAASTHNPVGSAHGVACGPRIVSRGTFPRDCAAAARSSLRHSNRVRRESVSTGCGAILSILLSTQKGVPSDLHRATIGDRKIHGIVRSSGRHWAGSHAKCVRSPSPTVRDRIPEWRASADTSEHPANSSIAFPVDNAREKINPMPPWKHPRLPAERTIPPRNRV